MTRFSTSTSTSGVSGVALAELSLLIVDSPLTAALVSPAAEHPGEE